jgi:hypothetical protein
LLLLPLIQCEADDKPSRGFRICREPNERCAIVSRVVLKENALAPIEFGGITTDASKGHKSAEVGLWCAPSSVVAAPSCSTWAVSCRPFCPGKANRQRQPSHDVVLWLPTSSLSPKPYLRQLDEGWTALFHRRGYLVHHPSLNTRVTGACESAVFGTITVRVAFQKGNGKHSLLSKFVRQFACRH